MALTVTRRSELEPVSRYRRNNERYMRERKVPVPLLLCVKSGGVVIFSDLNRGSAPSSRSGVCRSPGSAIHPSVIKRLPTEEFA